MLSEIGVTHIISSFCILSAWFVYLHTDLDKVLKTYTNRDSNEWSIYFLWKASYGYTVVKHYLGKLHSTFPLIHSFADSMKKLSNQYTNPQNKPNEYPWASITRFTDNSDGTYKISEDYYDIVELSYGDDDTLEKLINMSIDVLQSDDTITECLIKLSISPEYTLFRVINRTSLQMKITNYATTTSQESIIDNDHKKSILKTSSLKFLSIEYEHPDMNEPICIKLPTSFYLEGNCILSAAFINQWLSTCGQPFVFDNRYTIYIIDQDVSSISLSNKEYITILSDKKYTICTYLELPVTDIFSVENQDICKDDNNNNNQLITKEMDDTEETKSWDRLSM
jgi:hypothetical protein